MVVVRMVILRRMVQTLVTLVMQHLVIELRRRRMTGKVRLFRFVRYSIVMTMTTEVVITVMFPSIVIKGVVTIFVTVIANQLSRVCHQNVIWKTRDESRRIVIAIQVIILTLRTLSPQSWSLSGCPTLYCILELLFHFSTVTKGSRSRPAFPTEPYKLRHCRQDCKGQSQEQYNEDSSNVVDSEGIGLPFLGLIIPGTGYPSRLPPSVVQHLNDAFLL